MNENSLLENFLTGIATVIFLAVGFAFWLITWAVPTTITVLLFKWIGVF